MELMLDHACNLRCTYCYNGAPFPQPMTPEVMEAAVALGFSRGQGPVRVGFFGGEPLMAFAAMREGVRLAREASARTGRSVSFTVTTNGTLLSGDRLDFLAREGFRVAVSLDGPADVHDRHRRFADGTGSHALVARHVREALPRLPNLAVASVLRPDTAGRARDVFDHAASLGARRLHLGLDYHAPWDESSLRALEAGLLDLADAWVAAWRRGRPLVVGSLEAKILRHVLHPLMPVARCSCGSHEWTAAPSGSIYPCDRLVGADTGDGVRIGDVFRGFDPAQAEAFQACHRATPDPCAACDDAHRCSFWGTCIRHAMTGRIDTLPEGLCRMERALMAAADRAATPLYAEGHPGFMDRFYRGPLVRKALLGLGLRIEDLLEEEPLASPEPGAPQMTDT